MQDLWGMTQKMIQFPAIVLHWVHLGAKWVQPGAKQARWVQRNRLIIPRRNDFHKSCNSIHII